MSVPDENPTYCTLLVQGSPQTFTDYCTMLFPTPLHSSDKACKRERERERERESRYDKSTKDYKHSFYERATKFL